jgi:hypothetical protein
VAVGRANLKCREEMLNESSWLIKWKKLSFVWKCCLNRNLFPISNSKSLPHLIPFHSVTSYKLQPRSFYCCTSNSNPLLPSTLSFQFYSACPVILICNKLRAKKGKTIMLSLSHLALHC